MKQIRKSWIIAGVAGCIAGVSLADSVEERLAALEEKLEQQTSEREEALTERIRQLENQVSRLQETPPPQPAQPDPNITGRMLALEDQVAGIAADQARYPLEGVTLGGYGELHYNGLSGSGGASDKRAIDFHRFVLMVGKEFSDRVRFFSELEIEHAYSGNNKPGAVELEQAYVDFDLNDNHTARAGLFLLPVGLLNETHEPTRFYGVERNPIEKNIIPTTWWEGGAGMHGRLTDSLNYAAYVHSGLETTMTETYSVRSGRQKVAKANASDPAATVALNWNRPGITIGGSANYQLDITQGADPDTVPALFGELHLDLQRGPWGLRMLYAEWHLDGDGPKVLGADRQFGWFVEPSYQLTDTLGLFVRYNRWDNQAGSGSADSGKEQVDVGINWWPHEQVVVKADYQWQSNENGANQDGVNLGVGYEF